MTKEADQDAISALEQTGAIVKRGKSGKPLVVDFRPTTNQTNDENLVHLKSLNSIREIYLDGTAITDASLASITHLAKLTTLDLQRTAVTDAALESVKSLPALKVVLLTGSRVSRDAVNKLRKQMIKTRIVYI